MRHLGVLRQKAGQLGVRREIVGVRQQRRIEPQHVAERGRMAVEQFEQSCAGLIGIRRVCSLHRSGCGRRRDRGAGSREAWARRRLRSLRQRERRQNHDRESGRRSLSQNRAHMRVLRGRAPRDRRGVEHGLHPVIRRGPRAVIRRRAGGWRWAGGGRRRVGPLCLAARRAMPAHRLPPTAHVRDSRGAPAPPVPRCRAAARGAGCS